MILGKEMEGIWLQQSLRCEVKSLVGGFLLGSAAMA